MTKKTSAGVIITDGTNLLLGRITGGHGWDIPKGGVDAGESHIEGAIRELREETGLIVSENELSFLGEFNYTPRKDLVLYLWRVEQMPDTKLLFCDSTFRTTVGKNLPEFDGFLCCDWKCVKILVNDNLYGVLSQIKEKIQ